MTNKREIKIPSIKGGNHRTEIDGMKFWVNKYGDITPFSESDYEGMSCVITSKDFTPEERNERFKNALGKANGEDRKKAWYRVEIDGKDLWMNNDGITKPADKGKLDYNSIKYTPSHKSINFNDIDSRPKINIKQSVREVLKEEGLI